MEIPEVIDNQKIYDANWNQWRDMKFYGPTSRWLRSLIFDHLKSIEKEDLKTWLDVGSGEGTNTYFFAKELPTTQIEGIDFSKTGIEASANTYKAPNLKFKLDVDSLSLKQKYDMVSAYEVLEHVEDWQDLLGRMAGASNKYVMVSFPTGRMRPYEVVVGHLRNFKKGEVETFMKTKGFEPVNVFYAGFPFYSPFYREVCNLTNSAGNDFTTGKYGFKQKIVAKIIYFFFRHLSTQRNLGDQFCGLFRRIS